MENFEFYSPTYFVFGKGTEAKTGELVKKNHGTKVLSTTAAALWCVPACWTA